MDSIPGRILVVDDDRINRLLLCSLLKTEGHEAAAAEDGRRALEILAERPFDVVLLDLVMPEIDGFQVLASIKADPALQHIPVIVISALDEKANVVRSIEMGAADYLEKPPDMVLLRARVNASLTARRLLDEQVAHLRLIGHLTAAAADVQAGRFEPGRLAEVSLRPDALGQLARVFSHMALEVRAREQQLEEQNRVKASFIRRMTHELRSPFVAAGFSVQLLRRYAEHGMLDELREQTSCLEGALAEGRRLIDGMINYASLVSRHAPRRCEPIAMGPLIHEATAHLQSLAKVRSVQLTYDLPDPLPPVFGDRADLAEAIGHLVHNAIKFNHNDGRVLITCRASERWLSVTVEDTGRGIEPEKLQIIWEAFGQAADDEQRGVEGMGRGLALVSHVIAAHGGEVAATSRVGQGSTFGFRLPLASSDQPRPSIPTESQTIPGAYEACTTSS
ncbi:MAG: hybrid sensor histidine kinase/response regulator [Chloroflexales bacterium]|nr:hybrid sensor histidine kinase/response regulator [Chloroflexales bacterium]